VVSTGSGPWNEITDEIATKIGNVTGWSRTGNNQGTAGELNSGEYVGFSMPTGEDMKLEMGSYEGHEYEFGESFDTSNGSWTNRYERYPRDTNDGGYAPITNDPIRLSDQVTYWFSADGNSWVFYLQREESDGKNRDMAVGCARVDEAWNLSAANASFSEWAFLGAGGLARYARFEFTNNYSTWDKNSQGPNFDGWVVGNPDANFTDAPAATPNVITADPLQVEGRDTIIGTHDLWYENRGGLAHKDTVSIDGTNYTVYAAEDVWILFKD